MSDLSSFFLPLSVIVNIVFGVHAATFYGDESIAAFSFLFRCLPFPVADCGSFSLQLGGVVNIVFGALVVALHREEFVVVFFSISLILLWLFSYGS